MLCSEGGYLAAGLGSSLEASHGDTQQLSKNQRLCSRWALELCIDHGSCRCYGVWQKQHCLLLPYIVLMQIIVHVW